MSMKNEEPVSELDNLNDSLAAFFIELCSRLEKLMPTDEYNEFISKTHLYDLEKDK